MERAHSVGRRVCEGVPARNSSQESVYRHLADFNPSLADLYEGARQLLSVDEPLPGWGRFVPHAVREIVVRIPDFLEIPRVTSRKLVSQCTILINC